MEEEESLNPSGTIGLDPRVLLQPAATLGCGGGRNLQRGKLKGTRTETHAPAAVRVFVSVFVCACACVCVCECEENDAHGKTQFVLMQITCCILSGCKLFKTY